MDAIDLDIPGGEFFSMLGPSGCGKTTTLRMIAGFEKPDAGRIILNGDDMAQAPPNHRPVNTVFQNYALFPHLNVFDNVAFGLRRGRLTKDEVARRAGEALELVVLSGLEKRKPSELSGGQQQRVALARARRRACSSTNLWAPWTRSSGVNCRSSSRLCRSRWASRSST